MLLQGHTHEHSLQTDGRLAEIVCGVVVPRRSDRSIEIKLEKTCPHVCEKYLCFVETADNRIAIRQHFVHRLVSDNAPNETIGIRALDVFYLLLYRSGIPKIPFAADIRYSSFHGRTSNTLRNVIPENSFKTRVCTSWRDRQCAHP